jgi:hypothetical protein
MSLDETLDAFRASLARGEASHGVDAAAALPGAAATASDSETAVRRAGVAALEMEAGVVGVAQWRAVRGAVRSELERLPLPAHACLRRQRLLADAFFALVRGARAARAGAGGRGAVGGA